MGMSADGYVGSRPMRTSADGHVGVGLVSSLMTLKEEWLRE